MRLRKGDQVEVYSKKEVSSGSWSCAEIVSGNGRTYSIRYIPTEEPVEKVPRWAIRPCPPPVGGPKVWAAGDLAEAFHNSSWKQAKIMKIIGVDCYVARLLGSPLDILVSQSNLRMRQAWHDGQWFLLGKAFEDTSSLSRNRQTGPDVVKSKDRQLAVTLPNRLRKRPLLEETNNHKVSVQKRKVAKKGVRYLPSLEKTTDMYLPQELNRVRLSSTFPAVNIQVTTDGVSLRESNLIPRTSAPNHTDSCASSVGSNNSTDDFFKVPFISVANRSKKVEDKDYYSDAESSTGRGHEEEDSCSYEEALASFHRSELSLFRSFIRAMYASGPLSWEDERQISSIRAALHISNDEYLTELRNLMSANKKTRPMALHLRKMWVLSLVMTWNNLETLVAYEESQADKRVVPPNVKKKSSKIPGHQRKSHDDKDETHEICIVHERGKGYDSHYLSPSNCKTEVRLKRFSSDFFRECSNHFTGISTFYTEQRSDSPIYGLQSNS